MQWQGLAVIDSVASVDEINKEKNREKQAKQITKAVFENALKGLREGKTLDEVKKILTEHGYKIDKETETKLVEAQ